VSIEYNTIQSLIAATIVPLWKVRYYDFILRGRGDKTIRISSKKVDDCCPIRTSFQCLKVFEGRLKSVCFISAIKKGSIKEAK
jgi:hypothetical protein